MVVVGEETKGRVQTNGRDIAGLEEDEEWRGGNAGREC